MHGLTLAPDVYIGYLRGVDAYVGITKNFAQRSKYWEKYGLVIERITDQKLTRRQARAIEQALILRDSRVSNPEYWNRINSIAEKRTWYKEAIEWGSDWLKANNL